MSNPSFDYAIIGTGAAGFHLAIQFAKDPFFQHKKILILEKDTKNTDDRTWSFWEKGATQWDALAEKKWDKARFYGVKDCFNISLKPYHYKTIRSSKFYAYAKEIINSSDRFTMIHDEVLHVDRHSIKTASGEYQSQHIFDSRITKAFFNKKEEYQTLTQHFLGWFIKTKEPVFKTDEIVMMDYRIRWNADTSFTYVLPFSPDFALVEFTLFNEGMIPNSAYKEKLRNYISVYLKTSNYTIEEVEVGVIPMSNYPFHRHHSEVITKIGTAGGWVRPSSGYSFKNAERYSGKIVKNIKKQQPPQKNVAKSRFRLYDTIFLRVLKERNDLGPEIFQTLYTEHEAKTLFRFLDEESTLCEDVKIMLSLNKRIFQKALLKSIF
ncbi:MAG: lycopene cyclase family protein [Ekhidna sp.]|nr:lycopene cyclase family protein [Ekhidna sp.]